MPTRAPTKAPTAADLIKARQARQLLGGLAETTFDTLVATGLFTVEKHGRAHCCHRYFFADEVQLYVAENARHGYEAARVAVREYRIAQGRLARRPA